MGNQNKQNRAKTKKSQKKMEKKNQKYVEIAYLIRIERKTTQWVILGQN